MREHLNLRANIALGLIFAFLVNSIGLMPVYAQEFTLPAPGQMVALSPAFSPVVLKGIKLDPQNPFRFHFFVDTGDDVSLRGASLATKQSLKEQSTKLGHVPSPIYTRPRYRHLPHVSSPSRSTSHPLHRLQLHTPHQPHHHE